MTATTLLLADSRFPGGGHVHSGGIERAVAEGMVSDVRSLEAFLRGRLATAGLVAAAFAAAAASGRDPDELDAEFDARTPSPAQRTASRAQGAGTMRAGRLAWPETPGIEREPHHSIVLGMLARSAHVPPLEAALVAAYLSVTGPASAAVRLLGLDPLEVNRVLANLADEIDALAWKAANSSTLPTVGAPMLDWLAEAHATSERRLFAS